MKSYKENYVYYHDTYLRAILKPYKGFSRKEGKASWFTPFAFWTKYNFYNKIDWAGYDTAKSAIDVQFHLDKIGGENIG